MLMTLGLIFSILCPIATFFVVDTKKVSVAGFPRLVISVLSAYPVAALIIGGHFTHLTNSQVAGFVFVATISIFFAGMNAYYAFIPNRNSQSSF